MNRRNRWGVLLGNTIQSCDDLLDVFHDVRESLEKEKPTNGIAGTLRDRPILVSPRNIKKTLYSPSTFLMRDIARPYFKRLASFVNFNK